MFHFSFPADKNFSILFYFLFRILIFVLTAFPLSGQGLLLDDLEYEKQHKFPTYDEGNKAELESLKGIYKIDLKPFCPEPQDQGFIASCTGWASGYGALTILQAIKNGWSGQKALITENAFSSLFIYNQIKKGSCEFGAYMTDAAILIRDKGDVLSKNYDKLKNKCDRTPSEQELKDAQVFRIKDFMTIFGTSDPDIVKVQRTKMSLAQNKPIVIGISLLRNFQNLALGSEYWYPTIGDTTSFGGHSMVVIGFDDGKEAFEVMNSWGPGWGNKGFIWIKYRDFGKYTQYGYVFIPENEKFHFFDITASLMIRQPTYLEENVLAFNDVQVIWKSGFYELTKGSSKNGDLLQPLVIEAKRDSYLYAFSVDSKNNIKVHWPRDAIFDSNFLGNHESAIIAFSPVNLYIPGKYSALRVGTIGNEYWCFLISGKPITDLNVYLKALQFNQTSDFNKRMKKVFGPALLSSDRIKYSADKMQAESDMTEEEIVPIILKIKVGN